MNPNVQIIPSSGFSNTPGFSFTPTLYPNSITTIGNTAQPSVNQNPMSTNAVPMQITPIAQQNTNATAQVNPVANNNVNGNVNTNTSPALGQAISDNYDSAINHAGTLEALLNGSNQNGTDDINGQYNAQKNQLDTQNAGGVANLQKAQTDLDQSSARSFRDLTNQMRGMINYYQNLLGSAGAGTSSASPMINYALNQQGNQNYGDLNQQIASQQTGINQSNADLAGGYKAALDNLDAQRKSQLDSLSSQYATQMANLENSKQQAQSYKAQTLAAYGQTALAQDALSHLQAINDNYNNMVTNLKGAYSNLNPVDISKYTNIPTVQPLQTNALTGQSYNNNAVQPSQTSLPSSILGQKGDNNSYLTF